jgi:hypothetical protein
MVVTAPALATARFGCGGKTHDPWLRVQVFGRSKYGYPYPYLWLYPYLRCSLGADSAGALWPYLTSISYIAALPRVGVGFACCCKIVSSQKFKFTLLLVVAFICGHTAQVLSFWHVYDCPCIAIEWCIHSSLGAVVKLTCNQKLTLLTAIVSWGWVGLSRIAQSSAGTTDQLTMITSCSHLFIGMVCKSSHQFGVWDTTRWQQMVGRKLTKHCDVDHVAIFTYTTHAKACTSGWPTSPPRRQPNNDT